MSYAGTHAFLITFSNVSMTLGSSMVGFAKQKFIVTTNFSNNVDRF